ncbi:PAS domain-containing sensor histidine kinase [Methanococcoides methylutens]|uniref:PAS domain-containing sensor histidine kinase n=1 Tax=Methanococcoides methylutens TaxID=2226 RepID=UPI0040448DCE
MLDSMSMGAWVVDKDENLTMFNKGMEQITGLAKEETIGTNLMQHIPEKPMKDVTHFRELLLGVKDSLKPEHYYSFPITTSDGTLIYLSGILIPLLDEKDNYDGMLGIVEDVIEQKREEKIPSNITEIYKKLDTIYKDSPAIAWLMTAEKDWPVEFVSENIAQFGYTPEDFKSGHLIYADIIHPDDREIVRFETCKLEMSERAHFKGEYRILTKSGDVRWVLDRTWLERDQSGIPAYYQGIIIDITDLKKTEEVLQKYADELAKLNEELKALDKMKNEFLSNVSHELKTPLVSIKGYTELINEGVLGEINDEQKKALSTIIRSSERLRRLVDSLLFISEIQADTVEYSFEIIQITEIIDTAVEDIFLQIEEKGLTLEKKVPVDLPFINGDAGKLADMLTNILDNAIKFTPAGGKISVAASEEKNNIHIGVSDNGIGVPKDLLPKLFQKFYQIDASTRRKYGGTGSGLYICQKIVEAHNGEIWMESEEGAGTTVHIMLPK